MTHRGPSSPARLATLDERTLGVKLLHAKTAFLYAQTTFNRHKAMAEIGDIRAEFQRRGLEVPA
jgi:hypothetical protein